MIFSFCLAINFQNVPWVATYVFFSGPSRPRAFLALCLFCLSLCLRSYTLLASHLCQVLLSRTSSFLSVSDLSRPSHLSRCVRTFAAVFPLLGQSWKMPVARLIQDGSFIDEPQHRTPTNQPTNHKTPNNAKPTNLGALDELESWLEIQ